MIGFVISAIFGAACSNIASTKHRNELGWFFLGLFFNIIALAIVLILNDPLKSTSRTEGSTYNRYDYEKYQ